MRERANCFPLWACSCMKDPTTSPFLEDTLTATGHSVVTPLPVKRSGKEVRLVCMCQNTCKELHPDATKSKKHKIMHHLTKKNASSTANTSREHHSSSSNTTPIRTILTGRRPRAPPRPRALLARVHPPPPALIASPLPATSPAHLSISA